jgi:hypothetical protein
MRNWGSPLVLFLLFAAPGLGQNASVNVRANADSCKDCRPFGKYLAEICIIYGDNNTLARQRKVSCSALPYPGGVPANPQVSAIRPKDQTITIKLVCDPAQKTACDPPNPKIGSDFFVSATADSGSPVQQTVLQGNVTPLGGSRTVEYRTNGPGPIIIRATVQATPLYTAGPPVDLILQASADASASDSCPVLPTSTATSTPLDAPTIVSLLGNPTPFILTAQGPNSIAIYSTREQLKITPTVNEYAILHSFEDAIAALAGRTAASLGITLAPAKPFSVELRIPHGSALGDLATRIGGLNYNQFTVADVGRGWVRVTAPTQPDCDTWKGFLTDIREMAWQLVSAPMSEKLFYLSSSDVATAFSGLGSPIAAPAAGSASAAPSSASPTPAAGSTPSAAASGPTSAPAASGSTPSAATSSASTPTAAVTPSATSSNATIAINQPPGSNIQISSDTTPCVVAGLAFGNSSACGSVPAAAATPGTSSAAATPSVAPAPLAPLAMASVAVAAGTGEQTPPDLLVYSDTNPGDDAQIVERNRILAGLDLPRPEMILSAWVTQNSTANPQAMGAFNNMVKQIVANYNDEYERVVLNGWLSLKRQQADDPGFFNEPFRSYIADRFVADTNMKRKPGATVQELSQAFLDQSQAKMADPVPPVRRTNLGICEHGRYCLGYIGLFRRGLSAGLQDPDADNSNPIRPTLTDLLLAIIAAQQPVAVALRAIEDVEGDAKPVPLCEDCVCDSEEWYKKYLEDWRETKVECRRDDGHCSKENIDWKIEEKVAEVRKRCQGIWHNLDLDHVSPPQPVSCEELDFRGILGSLLDVTTHEPRLHLQCFKEAAEALLAPGICKSGETSCRSSEEKQTESMLATTTCESGGKNCEGLREQVKSLNGEDAETLLAIGTEEQLKTWRTELTKTLAPLAICTPTDNICQRAKTKLEGLQKAETLDGGECKPEDEICKRSEEQLENSMTETLLRRASCERGKTDCETAVEQLRRLILTLANRTSPPYRVGLFRAAIADFLFNYKMSQQYPHEFVPYDLTQSANTLNNALSPLIDAFNRDLWSYQMFVRADMQYQVEKLNSRTDERCCVKKLFGLDKPSFFNDGVVTVRTISGQPTSVSVNSQSFLNGSTAPELPALLSSLASLGAPGGGGGGSSTTTAGTTTTTTTTTSSVGSGGSPGPSAPPATGLFGIYGALPAVLANYQTSYAQIGRQLSFTATPRSLATASSAEIAVTLNADESAGGPLYTGPGATDPAFNTSRVANHDTTTRVRVDSIKLFEVSSFSAIVERSRSRFPLLPPFVEIPYIGTFAGIPLGTAKEFHSSTAIISAYVVPTAADIAYGLHFVSDLAVDGLNPGPCSFFKGAAGPDVGNACLFRPMLSLLDVGPQQPIHEFNRNITRCFATDTSSDGCWRVSFENALESH